MQTSNQIQSTLIQLNCEGLYEDKKKLPIFSSIAEDVLIECGARISGDMDPLSVKYDIRDLQAQALEIEKAKEGERFYKLSGILLLSLAVALIVGGIIGVGFLASSSQILLMILPLAGIALGSALLFPAIPCIKEGFGVPALEKKLEETKKNIRFQPLVDAYTTYLKEHYQSLKEKIEGEIKNRKHTPSLLPKMKEQDEQLLTHLNQTLNELNQLYYHYANPAVREV